MKVIWALARNTMAQALRMKVAALLIVLFLIVAAFLPFTLKADDTQHGEIKVLMTYNLTIGMGFLTVLTILLSASVLDREIVDKHIFLVCTKPVHRWQVLVGKWLGILMLDGVLLMLLGVITLALVYYWARPDPQRPDDYIILKQQVLTSRRSIRPPEFSRQELLEQYRAQLREEGRSPEEIEKHSQLAGIERYIKRNQVRVAPGDSWAFRLANVPIPEHRQSDEELVGSNSESASSSEMEGNTGGSTAPIRYTVRYRIEAADGTRQPLHSLWLLMRPATNPKERLRYMTQTKTRSGEAREFQIPAELVSEEGELVVQFTKMTIPVPNGPPEFRRGHPVYFNMEKGLEVLAPVGSFAGNFARGLLLLFVRLAFLAAIGVAATSLVHFPTAFLILIAVITAGYTRQFFLETASVERLRAEMDAERAASPRTSEETREKLAPGGTEAFVQRVYYPFVASAMRLAPSFPATDPVPDLRVGREIRWTQILWQTCEDLMLRGGLVFALGLVFLYRRELARPYL